MLGTFFSFTNKAKTRRPHFVVPPPFSVTISILYREAEREEKLTVFYNFLFAVQLIKSYYQVYKLIMENRAKLDQAVRGKSL